MISSRASPVAPNSEAIGPANSASSAHTHEHIDDRHGQAVAHGRLQAVVAPGAEILADDRPDRARQREDDAEGDRDDAADDRPAGDRAVAETGDLGGDEGIADRRRDLRHHRRHADREERPRRGLQPRPVGQGDEMVDIVRAVDADAEQHETRQHRRDRRAVEPEIAGRR